MKNPCNKCNERQIGCHTGCEKYAEWKVWKNSIQMDPDPSKRIWHLGKSFGKSKFRSHKK